MRSTLEEGQRKWPPRHRCENCGWWKRAERTWFDRFLGWLFRAEPWEPLHGECKQMTGPMVDRITFRSYVCSKHTSAGSEDIRESLDKMNRAMREAGL